MIGNIQVLRAIAALLVVFVHCEVAVAPLGISDSVRKSFGGGVDLFFIISGFIMVHTTLSRSTSPREFLVNRLARVVPLYWLLTAAAFLVAVSKPTLTNGDNGTADALAKSLLFVPISDGDQVVPPVLFVGWSLNYEMLFYLIFAVGLLVRSTAARLTIACGAILGLVLLGVSHDGLQPELTFFTRPIMLEFVAGMLLAVVYSRLSVSPRLARAAVASAVVCAVLILAVGSSFESKWPLVAIPAVGLVASALVMERGGLAVTSRPLLALGAASYSLYLTHPFVAQSVNELAVRFDLLSKVTSPLMVLLIYAASCAVALATFKYVETPLIRVARRVLRLSPQASAARGLWHSQGGGVARARVKASQHRLDRGSVGRR